MAEGRIVLVYHEDLIANFPEVWDSDRLLATWLRLLALADKLWPSPAELPRGMSATAIKRLGEIGIIEVLPKQRFRVRGLDARRKAKQDAARIAAETRWGNAEGNADRIPDSTPDAMPHTGAGTRPQSGLALSSGKSSSTGVVKGGDEPEWPALQWLAHHYAAIQPNGGKLHLLLARLCEKHGASTVIKAMADLGDNLEARQYILGADNALNPIPQVNPQKQRQEDAEEKARQDYDRRVERTRREIAAMRGESA